MPAREFDILRLLLERAGEVVTAQEILARLWPAGEDGSNSLAVHVRRLRERLEPDPSRPVLLQTVRGVGYKAHRAGAA
jgi:two-component system response regulator RegX3